MVAQLLHAILKLADDAFTTYIIEVGLSIGRVGHLHLRPYDFLLETTIGLRRAHRYAVPRLWFYLETNIPVGILLKLVDDELGIGVERIMAIKSAMKSVDKEVIELGIITSR